MTCACSGTNSEGKEDENVPSSGTLELSVDFSQLALLMTDALKVMILYGYERTTHHLGLTPNILA